ncbi:hypothetical protein DPEC_G00254070 [Dallia pectoralis]|uniref:Uncharacterized protein n=1 Tax=Dallia pectoralis TaxID=75939 RepID=A0ACC2FU56_DALPE|nr:hypothetical protein DPEC_G00254070 [Dallia pectoralis]
MGSQMAFAMVMMLWIWAQLPPSRPPCLYETEQKEEDNRVEANAVCVIPSERTTCWEVGTTLAFRGTIKGDGTNLIVLHLMPPYRRLCCRVRDRCIVGAGTSVANGR